MTRTSATALEGLLCAVPLSAGPRGPCLPLGGHRSLVQPAAFSPAGVAEARRVQHSP